MAAIDRGREILYARHNFMDFASIPRKGTARRLQAVACLLAMTLVWTPLWAAAWTGASNCTGMMCTAAGHKAMAKANAPSPKGAAQAAEDASMQCEHESRSSVTKCSMSCCHTESRAFVASMTFDLPAAVLLSRSLQLADSLSVPSESAIFSTVAPPDHPPRLMHS